MKKKSVIAILTFLGVFLLTTSGNTQDFLKNFSLKFSGGIGNTETADLGDFIDSINSQFSDIGSLLRLTHTGEIKDVNWGLDIEGELIFNLSENFGLGFGLGYMKRTESSMRELSLLAPLARISVTWEPEFRVIPICLSGYYFYPVANKMNIFLKVGVGYYSAKIKFLTRQEQEGIFEPTGWSQSDGEGTDSSIGFQGGLGFEYEVSDNVLLIAEGSGRYVNFNDWDVEDNYTDSIGQSLVETGTFWYTEEMNDLTGKYYSSLQLLEERPQETGFRNVRKAEFGFSGFSFKVGIRIRFGR
jgi:opacity protein-like surface antigen